jgi:hypothetical protein
MLGSRKSTLPSFSTWYKSYDLYIYIDAGASAGALDVDAAMNVKVECLLKRKLMREKPDEW